MLDVSSSFAHFLWPQDIFKALFLTIIFIIIMNELLAKDLDGEENEAKGGGSYNKNEIDKMIQQLKNIQATFDNL